MKGSKLFFAVLMLIIQIVDMQNEDEYYFDDITSTAIDLDALSYRHDQDTTAFSTAITYMDYPSTERTTTEVIYP
jgi:hypothetical protein